MTSVTTDKSADVAGGCLLFLVAFVLSVPLALLRAYTATLLWSWLVVPFTGWPALGLPAFFGLAYVVGVLRYAGPSDAEKQARKGQSATDSMAGALGNQCSAAFYCGLSIGFGYLWHLWFTR